MQNFLTLIASPAGITTLGLLLDIAGVICLFFFGFPQPDVGPGIQVNIMGEPELSDEKAKKRRKYQVMSCIGLLLLVSGFALQSLGVWVAN